MQYRVISDSSSNLLEYNGNVAYTTVPLKILVDGNEFVDEIGLDTDLLVDSFEKSKTDSTSCPSVQEWLNAMEGYDQIFMVTISSNLSGSYNSAIAAKDEFLEKHPDAKIHIFDSLATGGVMEILIEKIDELAGKGCSFEEITNEVEQYHSHVKILYSLKSLNNLSKNGRVSPAIAKVANFLGIRFIGKATEKGTIQQAAIARGEKKGISTIYNEMLKYGFKGGKVRISHCKTPEVAEKVKELIMNDYPQSDVKICICTGLCSYYAERGGFIIGFEDF